MMTIIPGVLPREQAAHVLAQLTSASFVDGKLSAGEMARDVKQNLEMKTEGNQPTELHQIVGRALLGNKTFQDFAVPRHIAPPIFSKYEPGMYYGRHVDTPIMGQQGRLRSDMSLTLFLSDPADYDGGELTVDTPFGEQQVKLSPGDAVVYSSTTLHEVKPVTRGARIVALSWVESMVQDEGMREILFDLARATQKLRIGNPDSDTLSDVQDELYKVYANLMRREARV